MEVLITVTILSVVVSSLCGIYFAVADEWQRQDSARDSELAVSIACSRIGDYAAQGVRFKLLKQHGIYSHGYDVLAVCLPADKAYGVYVPVREGDEFKYREGSWVVFYLSDATGSYFASGDILWAATANHEWQIPFFMAPDSSWSLYPGVKKGRITPLDSITFEDMGGDYAAVRITVGSSFKVGNGTDRVRLSKCVTLRNTN